MKSTNPQMMKSIKVILKLGLRRWISKKFRNKSNSRKMPREKLILNGMTWALAIKLKHKVNKPNHLVRRKKKRKKVLLRREFLLQRVLDQLSKSLNTSETNQISPSLVTNSQQDPQQSILKLTIVAQLDLQFQHQLRKRIKTNLKVSKKQINKKGNLTLRIRDLREEVKIKSLKEDLDRNINRMIQNLKEVLKEVLDRNTDKMIQNMKEVQDKNNQNLKRKILNQNRNLNITLVA
jgi:hypothetical protein